MSAPLIRVVLTRGTQGDCTICALGTYLSLTYEDVLAAAARLAKKAHREGMWTSQIISTAKRLGVKLIRKRTWKMDEAHGILTLTSQSDEYDHVVVLHDGLVFDSDGAVWEPYDYFACEQYKPTLLLTRG